MPYTESVYPSNYKIYCPDFGEEDILYGDYVNSKYSWLRLVVHKCDPKKRSLVGKKCES